MLREVDCVLGVGWGCLAVSLRLLGRWGSVVSTGAAVELATGAAAAAAEVRGPASVAGLAVGEVGVCQHCFAFLDRRGR